GDLAVRRRVLRLLAELAAQLEPLDAEALDVVGPDLLPEEAVGDFRLTLGSVQPDERAENHDQEDPEPRRRRRRARSVRLTYGGLAARWLLGGATLHKSLCRADERSVAGADRMYCRRMSAGKGGGLLQQRGLSGIAGSTRDARA